MIISNITLEQESNQKFGLILLIQLLQDQRPSNHLIFLTYNRCTEPILHTQTSFNNQIYQTRMVIVEQRTEELK